LEALEEDDKNADVDKSEEEVVEEEDEQNEEEAEDAKKQRKMRGWLWIMMEKM